LNTTASQNAAAAQQSATHPRAIAIAAWLLLLLAIYIALRADRPPAPLPASASTSEFSAARAISLLDNFASRPHPVGSAAQNDARQLLFNQLDQLGLQPAVETHTAALSFGNSILAARVSNLIGRLPGTASTRPVVLVAHYDSVDRAPGAGDDGAGVAAILEAIRALKSGPPLKNDVVVLLTDGEELGLLGAQSAAAHDPWLKDAGVLFNFEGRGDRGPSVLFETSTGNRALIRQFARAVPFPAGSSLSYTVYQHMPNNTDFTIFRRMGIAGLNFAWDHRLEAYHSRLDTPANLDPGSLQQHGSYVLGLARAFGNLDLSQFPSHDTQDEVFFNWYGNQMVRYPQTWVMPLFAAATLLFAAALFIAFRKGTLTAGALFKGLLASFLLLIAPLVVTAACFWCLQSLFGARFLVGDTPSNYVLLVSLALIAASISFDVFVFFRRRATLRGTMFGALLLLWLITAALTFALPLAAYWLFWPFVFSLIAAIFLDLVAAPKPVSGGFGSISIAALVSAVPAVLFIAPLAVELFIALDLNIPTAIVTALFVAVGCLLAQPLLQLLVPIRGTRFVVIALAATAVAVATIGVLMSHPSAAHPMPDTLVYAVDGNTGDARWATYDTRVDPWTEQNLTASPHRGTMEGFWSPQQNALWNPAPRDTGARPLSQLSLIDDTATSDVRNLDMTLDSPTGNTWTRLTFPVGTQLLSATIDGETPASFAASSQQFPTQINLHNYGGSSIPITLKVRTSACDLTISDHLTGLPPGVSPRPDDRMAWYGSDYTLVTRQVRFCRP